MPVSPNTLFPIMICFLCPRHSQKVKEVWTMQSFTHMDFSKVLHCCYKMLAVPEENQSIPEQWFNRVLFATWGCSEECLCWGFLQDRWEWGPQLALTTCGEISDSSSFCNHLDAQSALHSMGLERIAILNSCF